MKNLTLWLLLLLCSTAVQAQEVNGRALTERNSGASAVSVNFRNSANKVVTNADGTFKIMAKSLPDTLVFEALGYEPYEVVITEKNVKDPNFEVVLLDRRGLAKEVVLTSSGAVATFDMDDAAPATLSETVVVSGKASGVSPKRERAKTKTVRKVERRDSSFEELPVPSMPAPPPPPPMSVEETYTPGDGADISRLSAPMTRGASAETVINGKKFCKVMDTMAITDPKVYEKKARTLTAGEVNDLMKWTMWEDFTEAEFNEYAKLWQLQPRARYTVQLRNPQNGPVVGEPVTLTDASGKVLWSAVTDNTGKAELWGGFGGNKNDTSQGLKISGKGFSLTDIKAFSNGINHIQVDRPCNERNTVELCFVVDATGSMSDEIDFLKLEIEEVIRQAFATYGDDMNLRVGSVFYRDGGDEYNTRPFEFTDDLLKVLNFIKLQHADGGGDTPEALHSGLEDALKLNWSSEARTKIAFIVSDAPPHLEDKEAMATLTAQYAQKGIRLVPIACSGTDKFNEYLLRAMALATNGTYVAITNHSGVGGGHEEPLTDSYRVELLGDLLARVIEQYTFVADCNQPIDSTSLQPPVNNNQQTVSGFLKASPNPTRGPIFIEYNDQIAEVYLADYTGKILERLNIVPGGGTYTFDLNQYPSGMYLIRYITTDKKYGAEKIILTR